MSEKKDVFQGVTLDPLFNDGGVASYQLSGGNFANQYYVVSDKGTRKLLNEPEVVGYEVYTCLLHATSRMMRYFKEQGKVTSANILSILRGALNYPLEESCYREQIRVHDISFLSSERVFHHDEIAGLEIKYSKLATVPDSTLLIGDIVATGETLIHCLRYVTENYRKHGAKLRNIIVFTIGGSTGITVMEELTKEIKQFWPEFEGFLTVFYEGVFTTYQDKGATGIQMKDVDFYWRDGITAPQYRYTTLQNNDALLEKCIIYDGGARRYEISDHIDEVLAYWHGIQDRAEQIDMKALLAERLGYSLDASLEEWVEKNHYEHIKPEVRNKLYRFEQNYIRRMQDADLKGIAKKRIDEIEERLQKYRI